MDVLRPRWWFILIVTGIFALLLALLPELSQSTTIASVAIQSKGEREAGPYTFAMIFKRSEAPESVEVHGMLTQVDAKRRWDDGSLKHAVITVELPRLPRGATRRLDFVQSAQKSTKGSFAGFVIPDLAVTFGLIGGPKEQASLKRASFQAPQFWLNGPLVSEVILPLSVMRREGEELDLNVIMHLRRYHKAGTTRISVVVENTWVDSPGGVPYDVFVHVGGNVLWTQKNVGVWPSRPEATTNGHVPGTRWIKRFWVGRSLDDIHLRYHPAYLAESGLLPRYDWKQRVQEAELARMEKLWNSSEKNVLQRGLITAYFPTTGGREDIGPLPAWAARDVMTQDPRAREVLLGLGDLSGTCPIHYRDRKTGRFLSIDDHPGFSFNNRGTREVIEARDKMDSPWIRGRTSPITVDDAHQPSLAYLPYLLTGDYYYFEELCFWAAYNLAVINASYRELDKGIMLPQQIRGVAWTLRTLAHAAAISPDDSFERAYFEEKLKNNIDAFLDEIHLEDASPLGAWQRGANHSFTRGWTMENGWRTRYYSYPPWQHNFLAWTFTHLVDHGYQDAVPVRDFLLGFPIGLCSHPEEITQHAASSYFLVIGERRGDVPSWVRSWPEIDELSFRAPRPPGVAPRERPIKTSGDYAHILRGVLLGAANAGLPRARESLMWLDKQLPKVREYLSRDPTWALR